MVPRAYAYELGVFHLPSHAGARAPLVFAEHLEDAVTMSRAQMITYMGHALAYGK